MLKMQGSSLARKPLSGHCISDLALLPMMILWKLWETGKIGCSQKRDLGAFKGTSLSKWCGVATYYLYKKEKEKI